MGCWGMGMTQSDQFMEVYESFMDEYNEGASVHKNCIPPFSINGKAGTD